MSATRFIIILFMGVVWGICSYRLVLWKGRPLWVAWVGALLGFLTGLIGLGIAALIPSTLEAKEKHLIGKLKRPNLSPQARVKAEAKLNEVRQQLAQAQALAAHYGSQVPAPQPPHPEMEAPVSQAPANQAAAMTQEEYEQKFQEYLRQKEAYEKAPEEQRQHPA